MHPKFARDLSSPVPEIYLQKGEDDDGEIHKFLSNYLDVIRHLSPLTSATRRFCNRSKTQNTSINSTGHWSLLKVVDNLPHYINDLEDLPPNVKDRLLNLMSKRGTITDRNIAQVIQCGVRVVDFSDCDDISDSSIQVISRVCKRLQKIDLNCTKGSRPQITEQGIVSLARGCPLLHTVYLRRCSNITDASVVALSENCRHLRHLNIGGCPLLTDAALTALGQNCHGLVSINFSHAQVTDNGVINLVCGSVGPTLKELHMTHCTAVTDEAVEAVVQFCPQISILLFSNCPKTTDQSRLALEEVLGGQKKMKQVTWTIY